jgi:UDP-N-acetyl-D-mannosaminuronic acid dehydrogenase
MSLKVIDALVASGEAGEIRLFDPVVEKGELEKLPYQTKVHDDFNSALSGAHLVVICNNHKFFSTIPISQYLQDLDKQGVIYDYWNNLEHEAPEDLRGRYFTVGNASRKTAS